VYNISVEGSKEFLFANREPLLMVTPDSLDKNRRNMGSGSLREAHMNKNSGVYEIVNTVNGKRYIGSSVCIYNRLNQHINLLRRGKSHNKHLQNAFNKYGEISFLFHSILYCDPDMLVVYEQLCMGGLHPQYNKSENAEAPTRGIKFSEERRAKISEQKKGNNYRAGTKTSEEGRANIAAGTKLAMQSPEVRAKISAANKGKPSWNKGIPMSNEMRVKLMASHLGYVASIETRAKMSASQKGKIMTVEARVNMSAAQKGRLISEAHREKLSISHKGHKASDETKAKMSASQKGHTRNLGRVASPETREKMSAARRGENGSNSKLTWDQVREIRSKYVFKETSQRKLAVEYGVDQQVIWAIVNNKTWRSE